MTASRIQAADTPVIRLYMVRHGQTTANLEGKVAGQAEFDLTPLGEQQAYALGQSRRIPFSSLWRLYSSDLKRTQETGKFVQLGAIEKDNNNLPLQEYRVDKRIRELSKGAREGYPKTMTEDQAKEAPVIDAGRPLLEDEFPVVESEKDGFQRFSSWLKDVIRDAPQGNGTVEVLMVAHSALIRAVLKAFFSNKELDARGAQYDQLETKKRLVIPNTSVSVIDVAPNTNHPVWNQDQAPTEEEVKDPTVWKATLVELTYRSLFADTEMMGR